VDYIGIDDVTLEYVPPVCNVPLSVGASAVTNTTATISWSEPTPAPGSGYEYEIRTSGAAGSGSTGLKTSGTTGAGVTTTNISGLAPYTTYHAYVRSNCGDNIYSDWTSDYQFMTLPTPIVISGGSTDPTCFGACDGTIVPVVSGGVPPYSYLWNNSSTATSLTGLCEGVYSLTVTDAVAQTASSNYTLTAPSQIFVTGLPTDVTCYGDCNGAVVLNVSGGTPGYTFFWSGPSGYTSTASSISSLCAGTYNVTVFDSHQCTGTASFTVNQPTNLIVTGQKTDVTCNGVCDGTISMTAMGGTPGYTYLWSGPGGYSSTSSSLTGLCPGSYYVTVQDANLCMAIASRTIYEPSSLMVSGNVTNASCPGASDGSISTTVTGGTSTYTYLWSTGATTPTLSGIAQGIYGVTVTDVNMCVATGEWTVDNASSTCANISVTGIITSLPEMCYSATNTITVAGGGTVFEVSGTGSAIFIAGAKISYLPGTKVYGGGKMVGKIAPSGPFCPTMKITEVAAGSEETPMVTERPNFNLYPNPTNGNFTLIQKGESIYNNVKVEVYTMSGEKVLTENMIGQKHEFSFSGMPGGLYFVKVVAEGYVETIKLVKTR
jgi:hypothetical protein